MAVKKREETEGSMPSVRAVVVQVDDDERIARELLSLSNWSEKIRYLHKEGFRNGAICKILTALRPEGKPMKPQHVSNVLNRPLKSNRTSNRGRPPNEDLRAQQLVKTLTTTPTSTPTKEK